MKRMRPTLVRAVAHNNRGDAYVAQGNFEAAINDYDQAISLNPDFARPFNNRGFAYLKKGESDRALKDFDQAIKLKPDYGRAFANRAEAYQCGTTIKVQRATTMPQSGFTPKWAPCGTGVAGRAQFSASCSPLLRIATRRFR